MLKIVFPVFLTMVVAELLFSHAYAVQAGELDGTVSNSERLEQCIQLLDPVVLQKAQQRGYKLDKKITVLCQHAKRNEAQNLAYDFANDIQKSKHLLAFRACNHATVEPFSAMQQMMQRYFISNLRFTHVCDMFN